MNRKWIAAAAVGAVALAGGVALAASAARGPERAKQFVSWRLDDALDDLDATDAQRGKAHALKDRLFEEGQRLHATKEDTRAALVEQWRREDPDRAAVHAAVDRMADEARAFAHQAADAALELHRELTPEQRAELLERAQERRSRWHR